MCHTLELGGYLAYVRILYPKRIKLASRAYECVFEGCATNSKAYRFYNINAHNIIESNDADFYETKFPFKLRNSGGTSSTPIRTELDKSSEVEPRRSKRARTVKDFGSDFSVFTIEEGPLNLQEALSSLDADFWREAINDEMDSLESNKTWHLTDLPPGCKSIGCKWVLKKKLKPNGTIDKYKARLVARGF